MEPIGPGRPGDFGEPERLDTAIDSAPPSRVRAIVLAAVVAGAGILVAITAVSATLGQSAPAPGLVESPSPSPAASTSVDWPTPQQPSPRPARPPVFASSGFLAELHVDVFVRSSRALFRIETKAKRVTRTPLDGATSSGVDRLLVLPDRVLVLPIDETEGTQVVDGQPATKLDRVLTQGGQYLPGPSNRIWAVEITEEGRSVARLTDASGRRVYETVRGPGYGYFSDDGSGGLLYNDIGGVYRAGPTGLRRVTSGTLFATGAEKYLVIECTERFVCSTYALRPGRDERDSRRRIGPARPAQSVPGTLSPDGRYAAHLIWGDGEGPAVVVSDVTTGRRVASWPQDARGESPLVWLPDGRLMFLRDSRLAVLDPRTGQTVRTTLRLPPLTAIAVRSPGG